MRSKTTIAGSRNEGVQIGQNQGAIVISTAQTGRLSFLFYENLLSFMSVMTDKDNSCLADLLLTNPRSEKIRIERAKGGLLTDSFRWILNNSEFQRWREGNHSQLLWIKGDAGKGKTMLMIGIINEPLQQVGKSSVTEVLSYFLCQGTDSRLINTATAILRGIIYLLASEQPSLISHLRKKHSGSHYLDGVRTTYPRQVACI